jgi:hypothetical protein
MEEHKTCSKCNSKLEAGFFYVTNSDHPINFNYTVWVKGERDDITKFMGTNARAPQHPVRIYKCEACGHLEFYAEEPHRWRH